MRRAPLDRPRLRCGAGVRGRTRGRSTSCPRLAGQEPARARGGVARAALGWSLAFCQVQRPRPEGSAHPDLRAYRAPRAERVRRCRRRGIHHRNRTPAGHLRAGPRTGSAGRTVLAGFASLSHALFPRFAVPSRVRIAIWTRGFSNRSVNSTSRMAGADPGFNTRVGALDGSATRPREFARVRPCEEPTPARPWPAFRR